MSRTFKTVDYAQTLDLTVRLGDCLPPNHLARFVVDSVALLDLSALYARYGSRGGEPYDPEVLLGLLQIIRSSSLTLLSLSPWPILALFPVL